MSGSELVAHQFLSALFREAPKGNFAELRGLCRDANPVRRFWPLDENPLQAVARTAVSWARDRDVFVGVLPRTRRDGTAAAVDGSAWLWVDLDAGADRTDGAEALLARAALPEPAIVVGSGRGLHVYWRVSPPIVVGDLDAKRRFSELLRRLARHIGSAADGSHADPACADIARVLRVPGTQNHKKNPGLPVRLLRCDERAEAHSLVWWGARLPALPLPPTTTCREIGRGGIPGDARLRALRRWAARPYRQGERHARLAADAAWLGRSLQLDPTIVRSLIEAKAHASAGSDPLSAAEVEGILRWV